MVPYIHMNQIKQCDFLLFLVWKGSLTCLGMRQISQWFRTRLFLFSTISSFLRIAIGAFPILLCHRVPSSLYTNAARDFILLSPLLTWYLNVYRPSCSSPISLTLPVKRSWQMKKSGKNRALMLQTGDWIWIQVHIAHCELLHLLPIDNFQPELSL